MADWMRRVLADAAAYADPALPSRLRGLLMVPDGQRVSELSGCDRRRAARRGMRRWARWTGSQKC